MPDTITLDQVAIAETLDDEPLAGAIATELGVKQGQAARTLELLDGGATVPFIARYRKEMTGALDEVQIQAVSDRAGALRALHERKRDVLRLIAAQGKLTDDLAASILESAALQQVDDLYLPYRPKRKTRASVARERSLQPLADLILSQARLPGSFE